MGNVFIKCNVLRRAIEHTTKMQLLNGIAKHYIYIDIYIAIWLNKIARFLAVFLIE